MDVFWFLAAINLYLVFVYVVLVRLHDNADRPLDEIHGGYLLLALFWPLTMPLLILGLLFGYLVGVEDTEWEYVEEEEPMPAEEEKKFLGF